MYLNVVIWVHSVVYVHYTKSESRATGSFLPQICLRRWDFLRNNIRNIWSRQPKQRGEGNMGNTPLLTRKNTLDDTRKLPRQKWNWWVQIWKVDFFETKSQSFTPGISNTFHFDDWNEIIVVNDGKKHFIFCPMIDLVKSWRSTNKKQNLFMKNIIPSNNDWHIENLLRVTFFNDFSVNSVKGNNLERRKSDLSSQVLNGEPMEPRKKKVKHLKDQSNYR